MPQWPLIRSKMKTSEIYLFTFILSNISKVWLKTEGFSPINSFAKFIDFFLSYKENHINFKHFLNILLREKISN